MQIYVEYVVIDNLVFNFLILKIALINKDVKSSGVSKFLSALLGTAVAVVFPFFKCHQLILLLLKIVLALILVAVAGKYKSFKSYLLTVNLFVLCTFLFGGAIYAIFYLFGLEYSFLYGTSSSLLPLGFLLVCAFVIYFLLKRVYFKLFKKRIVHAFVVKCKLFYCGEVIEVDGLIDSGNHLVYKGNQPVCVAGKRLAKKMLLGGFLQGSFCGELSFYTVSGISSLSIYKIDQIKIYSDKKVNIINRPLIAIANSGGYTSEEYDVILSADYCLDG